MINPIQTGLFLVLWDRGGGGGGFPLYPENFKGKKKKT